MGIRDWKRKLTVWGCPHQSGGSSPKAVDPYVQAGAQFGLNRDTALLGNQLAKTDSYSPTESTTWTSEIDPGDQARYDTELASYKRNMLDWQSSQALSRRLGPQPNPAFSNPAMTGNRLGGQGQSSIPGNTQASLYANAYQNAPTAPRAPTASKWTSRTQLTPDQQRLFDLRENAQETLLGQANDNLRKPLDFSGLDKQVTNLGLNNDFSGERQRVEDAFYNRSASRLDPQFKASQNDLETKLYNQGVQPGTEAWNRELAGHEVNRRDAYGDARTDAIGAGGAEQSRLYGMDYQTANQNAMLQNQGRQQGLNELFAMRQTPLTELNMLAGGQGGGAGAAGGRPGAGGQDVANTDIGGAFASDLSARTQASANQTNTANANNAAAASTVATIVAAAI